MPKFEIESYAFEDEPTSDGLGVFVHKKDLFHTPKHPSQPISARANLYLIPHEEIAIHYAKTKFSPVQPVVSSARVQSLKLVDFRKKENAKIFLAGFKTYLIHKLETENLNWLKEIAVRTAIENINPEKIKSGHLSEFVTSLGLNFKEYCQLLGYEGLIALEGGEGTGVNHHNTYIIFDPTKVKIVQEKILQS